MPRPRPVYVDALERNPASPAALTRNLWEVLSSSVTANARVDSVNWETGEYRVVLQGTIDLEETKFEQS